MDLWTTVEDYFDATPLSRAINWNQFAYDPLNTRHRNQLNAKSKNELVYYGAYRINREEYFHRYFDNCPVPLTISGARPQWKQNWPKANVVGAIDRNELIPWLAGRGMGLYIEDRKSHRRQHHPATRFYEMLSAGLPMVFQPEAGVQLAKLDIDTSEYTLNKPEDVRTFMKHREAMRRAQQKEWARDYRSELNRAVLKAHREQLEALS
jgi:hypothetical protein